MKHPRAAAVAATLALILPSAAWADPPASARVLLVRPAGADPATTEALTRIRGELISDGFAVVLVDSSAAPTSVEAPPDTSAMVGLSLDVGAHAAELLVVDRLTNKRLTRRIDTRGASAGHLAEVLAVRAVELLRASLLELSIEARPVQPVTALEAPPSAPSPAAVDQARRWAAEALPAPSRPVSERRPMWGLEAGASVMASPGTIGPAVLSFGRLRFAPIPAMEVRVAFAGLGTAPRVSGPHDASATVAQILGLAELAWLPWPGLRARPVFSLGAGGLRIAVEGEAAFPYQGTRSSAWSLALDAGVGVEVRAAPHFGVALETHAFVGVPAPVVRFLDEQMSLVARPGLLGSLTLVGWL